MSYKTDFQSNNADLQTVLDIVTAMPEAGGASTTLTINHSGDYSAKVYHRPFDATTYTTTTVGYSDTTTLTLGDGWFVVIVANDALYMCAQTTKGTDSTIRYSGSTFSGTNCTVKHVYNVG